MSDLNLKTEVEGKYLVSTVLLRNNFGDRVGIYETMVFEIINGSVSYADIYCRTARNAVLAQANHDDAVQMCERTVALDKPFGE